jgi:hypothetical protein
MEMKLWIKKNKNANEIPGKEIKFLKVSSDESVHTKLKKAKWRRVKYIFRNYVEKRRLQTKTVKSKRTHNSRLPKLALRYTPKNADKRRTRVRWPSSRNRLSLAQE